MYFLTASASSPAFAAPRVFPGFRFAVFIRAPPFSRFRAGLISWIVTQEVEIQAGPVLGRSLFRPLAVNLPKARHTGGNRHACRSSGSFLGQFQIQLARPHPDRRRSHPPPHELSRTKATTQTSPSSASSADVSGSPFCFAAIFSPKTLAGCFSFPAKPLALSPAARRIPPPRALPPSPRQSLPPAAASPR